MHTRRRSGFTLVETMISLVLLAIVMGAMTKVTLQTQRGYVRQREVVAAEDALRAAEIMLVSALRTAGANPQKITGADAPALYPDPLSHGQFDNLRVVADFNPADGDVDDLLEDVEAWIASDTLYIRWMAGDPASAAAAPISSMSFEYYDADDNVLAAADIDDATRVKLTLSAPRHSRTGTHTTREQWVYLRNH